MSKGDTQADSAVRMYDARAETYEDSWHPDYSGRLIAQVPLRPGDRVLSLCCGTGLDVFLAAERVGETGHVVGVDISPAMLAKARQRRERDNHLGPRITLVQHSVTALDSLTTGEVPEGSFDVLICSNAFVLLDDPAAVVRAWRAYLPPGGCAAIDITHEHNMRSGLVMERVAARLGVSFPSDRAWIRSRDSFAAVLQQEGYVVEHVAELEKVVGQRATYYPVDQADAQFEYVAQVAPPTLIPLVFDDALRERAREIFREEFAKDAVDGKVEVVEMLYLYIARKPE